MIDLKNEILSRIKPIINSWTEDDIYAVSLFVYDIDDDPQRPTFTLGFNTESVYLREAENEFTTADEARWNYAFWQQNCELIFGENETEEIVSQWAKNAENVTDEFVNVLVEVVKELHESEFIKTKFKKAIPVIIHELEYYEKIAAQNIEANTLPLVQGLVDFIYC